MLKDLTHYLLDLCDENHFFQDRPTTDRFIWQLKRRISIFNIDILMILLKKFKSSAVKKTVQKYKQQLDAFLSSTSITQLKDVFQSQRPLPTDFDSLTMKLDESKAEATLAALKKLAYHLFGISSKTLILFKVGAGCITIKWLAPMVVVPILRKKAEHLSPATISRLGVLELVIGLNVTSPKYQG